MEQFSNLFGRALGGLRGGFTVLLAAALVAGCGGSDQRDFPPDSSSGSGGSSGGGSVALTVVDAGTGQTKNTISSTTQSIAKAVVTDASGSAVANAVVSFQASDSAAIVFSPAATALTDGNGLASVTVGPASLSTAGAYTLTASTQIGSDAASGTFNVAIGAAQVALGSVTIGQSPLSAYGTTLVSVPVTGVSPTTPVSVRFSSTCAAQNPQRATITSLVSSVNGVARATYVDKGCASTDLVTATVEGTGIAQSANLQVIPPAIANIQFVGASPQSLVTRSTGGVAVSEISSVTFRVIDEGNNPVTLPTAVTLALSNTTGGITIDGGAGPVTRQTDANGEVTVQVRSGTIPSPVWVIASLQSQSGQISTNSILLTVTTGQPIQSKFSLSASTLNVEGWRYDGERSTLQIIAADIFGTPVPDGTTVNFVGDLVGASCSTVAGVCSVDYLSQGERPANGRVHVVAYAVGEESFFDTNGNFRYDAGEPFSDLGYVYIDKNENNAWDPGEGIIPYLDQGHICVNPDSVRPNLLVRRDIGSSTLGACDGQWGLAHVRRSLVLTLSDSLAYFKKTSFPPYGQGSNIPTSYTLGSSCSVSIPFVLQDLNGNPMPYGTTVQLDLSAATSLKAIPSDVQTVENTSAIGGTAHSYTVTGLDSTGACVGKGPVLIRVKTPKGHTTDLFITIS